MAPPRKRKPAAPKPKPRGRPLLLNDKSKAELIQAIQVGSSYEMACAYANVSYSSFHRWAERGQREFERRAKLREEIIELYAAGKTIPKKLIREFRVRRSERLFLEFWKDVTQANMVAGVGWLQVIDTVAQQSPDWSSWMLTKRFPNEFGRAAKQEVEVTTPQPMQVQHHHDGEVKVNVEPDIDRIAEIFGILQDAGAFEVAAEEPASEAGGSDDAAPE